MKKPTLTVFTSTYNRGALLHRGYEALCRQTCKDFCWIIVDDGSNDDTRERVLSWQKEKPGFEIRYIYKERLSPDHWRETLATVKHVYLYSKTLKGGDLSEIPEETTFRARNKKVANKLRKFGFKGSIVIEKNMK